MHRLILIAMGVGAVLGGTLHHLECSASWCVALLTICDLVGKTIFIGALKMLVAPLIMASVVAGVTSLAASHHLGRIGIRTLLFYLSTTAVATLIGITLVVLIQPGRWESAASIREQKQVEVEQLDPQEMARLAKLQQAPHSPMDFLSNILEEVLQNPFRALAESSSLSIIFFSILFGLGCCVVGEVAIPVVALFQGLNQVMLQITQWVMLLAPIGVFGLVTRLTYDHGPQVFQTLGGYVATVLLGIALHLVFLLTIAAKLGGVPVGRFLRGMKEALLIAFSTRSSAATLPVTMRCVEGNLGVSKEVSEFVLPIGATVNMDGTALYEGVAIIFLIQLFGGLPDVGIDLSFLPLMLIFITAMLASVGAAAVPDAGLITMVLVASAVGLPEHYLIYVFSVDAFLDMFRTTTNVVGDSVGSVVIQRWWSQDGRDGRRPNP